jgi:K+-sensing histidine kinase KdpD
MKTDAKIMVACDLSPHSGEVMRCGAQMAKDLDAELIIVNIINQRDVSAMQKAIAKIKTEVSSFEVTIDGYVKGQKQERTDGFYNQNHNGRYILISQGNIPPRVA